MVDLDYKVAGPTPTNYANCDHLRAVGVHIQIVINDWPLFINDWNCALPEFVSSKNEAK